jgi:hypothetical protein
MKDEVAPSSTRPESGVYLPDSLLTPKQRFYQNRWRAWGTFKRELWSLPQEIRDAVGESCEVWFAELFAMLKIAGRRAEVDACYRVRGRVGG